MLIFRRFSYTKFFFEKQTLCPCKLVFLSFSQKLEIIRERGKYIERVWLSGLCGVGSPEAFGSVVF